MFSHNNVWVQSWVERTIEEKTVANILPHSVRKPRLISLELVKTVLS